MGGGNPPRSGSELPHRPLVSLLITWGKIAEAFLKAKDDPGKLKAFEPVAG